MDESRVFNPLDLQLSRSVYEWTNHSMGTCMAGRLIPAMTFDVLPGQEMKVSLESLFKMSTPVYPTMDYLYADISFFFVPYKLLMSRRYASPSTNDASQSFEGFIGAQDFAINMPIPADGVKLPLADLRDGYNTSTNAGMGTLAEYLYGPDGHFAGADLELNALPEMAYFAIWNDNYREPNIQPAVTWNYELISGSTYYRIVPQTTPLINVAPPEASYKHQTAGTYTDALATTSTTAGARGLWASTPLPVSVFHGYFGSLLPWPQRNLTGVSLPVGGFAPLKVGSSQTALGGTAAFSGSTNRFNSETMTTANNGGYTLPDQLGGLVIYNKSSDDTNGSLVTAGSQTTSNLGIDLAAATAVNVEALRALIVRQHWYEDLQRSGNRLDELEYGTFGVRPKDSGCDRPVYLGGKRIQLNVEMVASTNGGTTSGSAAGSGSLGDLGAFSHTNDSDFFFHHGFDTWGCVQCVFTIRAHNLFASGVDRHWFKSTRDDFYWPEFARLGNQSTAKWEVQPIGSSSYRSAVLGYQEYAEEYREPRDMVTGLLVPGRSLGFMTYAHRFEENDTLNLGILLDASRQWVDIDRTLATASSASGFQFIYQFTFHSLVRSPVGRDVAPGVTRI